MSLKFPTISITAANDSKQASSSEDDSASNDNDMNYNLGSEVTTDVEDFNNHGGDADNSKHHSRNSSLSGNIAAATLGIVAKMPKDGDVTDVEDFNDSDSDDDEKSNVYPQLKLSLQDFLQHGFQEKALTNNEVEEKVDIKAGDFLQAQTLNGGSDYLTDCEDYDTESEIEGGYEKSVCVDLNSAVDDQCKVSITDGARAHHSRGDSFENENVSVCSDISDMASALSDATGIGLRGMSEDELLEMSAEEEVCRIAYSGSSESDEEDHFTKFVGNVTKLPEIDVTFVAADPQYSRRASPMMLSNSSSFLEISGKNDEVLTDIEGLDDSAAEEDSFDSENESDKPIPQAVILPSDDDDACCVTDTEDVFCEDSISCISSNLLSIATEILPPPHREIVVLREDKFGDTITSVEPMNNEYQFGIYYNKDEAPTDTEDYLLDEILDRRPSVVEEILSTSNLIEREVTIANEIFKPAMSKRIELHSNAESVTDIEELYVAGTNRRKKNKSRSAIGNKGQKNKFLDVNRAREDGGTDVEDMDLSEGGLPPNIITTKSIAPQPARLNASSGEKVTDVEDLTADESISDASGCEAPPHIDINIDGLSEYINNSANMVLTQEIDAASNRKYSKHAKLRPQDLQFKIFQDDGAVSQQHTDVEDIQMPSDNDEDVIDIARGGNEINCACGELNDMLNESHTIVHEKSINAFNIDLEKLHIKDRNETRDAHTDVEYMESDEPNAKGSK